MTHHKDLLDRLERANPVPEPSRLNSDSGESRRYQLVERRLGSRAGSKVRLVEPGEKSPWSNRRILIAAAASVIIGVGIGSTLLTGGDVAGRPAPPPTDRRAAVATIAEVGLPAVWTFTVVTQQTEVGAGVRLDTNIRLDSGQLSAEGTATQVVVAAEMIQGRAVQCFGTTYDEEFLWSATPRGMGLLDFGASGSVAVEFDAVVVTSSHMSGLGSRYDGGASVCGEWTGTYIGVSGDLAAASGTFNAIWATPGHSQIARWIFDS